MASLRYLPLMGLLARTMMASRADIYLLLINRFIGIFVWRLLFLLLLMPVKRLAIKG